MNPSLPLVGHKRANERMEFEGLRHQPIHLLHFRGCSREMVPPWKDRARA
jgi:hypothetical protein